MASRKIADLVVQMSADSAQLRSDMEKVRSQMRGMQKTADDVGSSISAFGRNFAAAFSAAAVTAGIAAITRGIGTVLKSADDLVKSADRIGISTTALQELGHAASLSGVSMETLDKSFQTFTKRVGEAKAGYGALSTALDKTNADLLAQIVNSKNQEEALNAVFAAISGLKNQTDKAALANAAFGRSGSALTTILKDGTEGLNEMRQEARDLGLVMDGDLLRAAEQTGDEFERTASVIRAQFGRVILETTPALQQFAKVLRDPAVIDGITGIANALIAMGSAMASVAGWVPKIRDFIGAELFGSETTGSLTEVKREIAAIKERLELLRNQENVFGAGSQEGLIAPLEKRLSMLTHLRDVLARQAEAEKTVADVSTTSAEQQVTAAAEVVKATTQSTKAADDAAKAEKQRADAIAAILKQQLPLQAKQQELLSQIALLDEEIKKETASTEDLTRAKSKLQQELEALQNVVGDTIKGHKESVAQLEAELAAIRDGEDAYRRFGVEQQIAAEIKDELNALTDKGVELTDAQRSEIEGLIRAEEQLRGQIEREKDAREEANRAWEVFVTEVVGTFINSTGSMGEAFGSLINRMKQEAINAGVGAALGFGTASTPLLSGISALASGGGSIGKLFANGSLFPKLESQLFGLTNTMVAQGGIIADAGLALNNAANSIAQLPGGLVGGGLITAGAGFVGGQLGASVFGQSGMASQFGGLGGALAGAQFAALGSLGGPLGALAGAFVGSAIDSVMGGDGPERRAAVFTGAATGGAEAKHTVFSERGASGLMIAGEAQRVGEEGRAAVMQASEQLLALDAALTELTRSAGLAVDLTAALGVELGGENAAREFVKSWVSEVSSGFDAELAKAAKAIAGDTAEELIAQYQAILAVRGNEIFAGIGSISQVVQAVGPAEVQRIAAFSTQLRAMSGAIKTDSIAAWESSQRSVFELWRDQGDAIVAAADVAATEADFVALQMAMTERYQTELALVAQINDALKSTSAMFAQSFETIFVSGLKTEEARYNYFRDQADEIARTLTTLTDPAAIAQAAEQYNARLMQAFSALGEGAQDAMRDEILRTVTEVEQMVQQRLDTALSMVESDGDAGVPGSTSNAVEAAIQSATAQMRDAMVAAIDNWIAQQRNVAIDQQQAAGTMQGAANAFGAWAGSLPSRITVELAGSEVAF